DPTNAQLVAASVTIPNKVLNITTAMTSNLEALNPAGSPPLLLRTNWSDRDALLTLAPFLDKWLVPRLKAEGMLGPDPTQPDGKLRVAILAEGDYKGLEGQRVLTDKLTWNLGADGARLTCGQNAQLDPIACTTSDFGSLIDTLG